MCEYDVDYWFVWVFKCLEVMLFDESGMFVVWYGVGLLWEVFDGSCIIGKKFVEMLSVSVVSVL